MIIQCKRCGGSLSRTEDPAVAQCDYCGTLQTIPGGDDEKKLALFERANRWRQECDFDKASGVYESIVADFPKEAEAWWGLVLCKYGIEYVDDPATGKKIPTCHRTSFDSIPEDPDYLRVLETATESAARLYRTECRQLERIRKQILELGASEQPYDIFICYKETDEKGERTEDSVLAQEIYDALTGKGYRVFFARISLEDKLGQAYEPYIFSALQSAKLMVVVATDPAYVNAPWVRNEWSRFLKLQTRGEKKLLIPCYRNMDPYELPKEFRYLQSQDLGKLGAVQDLLRGIGKLLPQAPAAPATAEEKPARPVRSRDPEEARCVEDYERAMDALRSDSVLEVQDAIDLLRTLGDWHNAKAKIPELEERLYALQHPKKRILRKRVWIPCLIVLWGFLGVCLWSVNHCYRRGMDAYEGMNYNGAISLLKQAHNYRNSEELIPQIREKIEIAEQALMLLVPGKDEWGKPVTQYQDSKQGFWLKFWYSGDDYHGPRIVVDPNSKDEALNYIFNPKGDQFYIHYDQYSQEYIFVDWNDEGGFSEFYRGTLKPDGTLYVYGPGGTSFLLIPKIS